MKTFLYMDRNDANAMSYNVENSTQTPVTFWYDAATSSDNVRSRSRLAESSRWFEQRQRFAASLHQQNEAHPRSTDHCGIGT